MVTLNSTLFGPASLLSAFERAAAEAGFAVSVGSVTNLDRQSISGAVERHLDHGVAGIVVASLLAQLACMARMLRDPRGLAPWYNGTGVVLYVTGMMVTAFALRGLA